MFVEFVREGTGSFMVEILDGTPWPLIEATIEHYQELEGVDKADYTIVDHLHAIGVSARFIEPAHIIEWS